MKVLVISHLFPSTANQVSGIFVKQQVAELVKQGCEVKVISPVPWTPFPTYLLSEKWMGIHQIPAEDEIAGVKVTYPRYLALPRNWLFARSGKRMYAGIQSLVMRIHNCFPFDLIHAHVALPDGYAAMLLAEEYQKPFIVTIHGRDLMDSVHRNKYCKKSISDVLGSAERTIFVSNKLKSIAESFIGNSSRYSVVSNGFSHKFINQILSDNSGMKGPLSEIVSVSNLIHRKAIDQNLFTIKRLIDRYPGLRYKVVGDGPEMEALSRLSIKLSIEKNVSFLGQLSHSDAMRTVMMSDIFSLPSWNEGFGIVYLEAMALGKPVIGCKGEGIEDFVVDGETGLLVEPKNLDQLIDAMEYLICNPERARKMGENARALVLEKYTWDKNAEQMIDIYRNAYYGM